MTEELIRELAYKDTTELLNENNPILLDIIECLHHDLRAANVTINELSNKIAKLVEEKVLLRIQISSREEVANDLQQRINKAIHRIQLLQMDNEVTVRDLGLIARDLKGEVNEI